MARQFKAEKIGFLPSDPWARVFYNDMEHDITILPVKWDTEVSPPLDAVSWKKLGYLVVILYNADFIELLPTFMVDKKNLTLLKKKKVLLIGIHYQHPKPLNFSRPGEQDSHNCSENSPLLDKGTDVIDLLHSISVKHLIITMETQSSRCYKLQRRFQKENIFLWRQSKIKFVLHETLKVEEHQKEYKIHKRDKRILQRQAGNTVSHIFETVLGALYGITLGSLLALLLLVLSLPVALAAVVFSIFYSSTTHNCHHPGMHLMLLPVMLLVFLPIKIFMICYNCFIYGFPLGIWESYSEFWHLFKCYVYEGLPYVLSQITLTKSQKIIIILIAFVLLLLGIFVAIPNLYYHFYENRISTVSSL